MNFNRTLCTTLVLVLVLTASAPAAGPVLEWATYYGDNDMDVAEAVAVAPDGSAVAVGFTLDFATFSIDAFIAQFSPDGTTLLNEGFLAGSGIDGAFGVHVDDAGIITVVGQTSSDDFPVTADALQDTRGGADDGFLIQLSPDFDLLYGTYLGGSGEESITDMAVDRRGAIVVCGYTASEDFPVTEGAFQQTAGGGFDAFVARIVPGGENQLTYSTYLGGSGDDCDGEVLDERLLRQAVAVMPNGNIAVAGMTWSDDFPVTPRALQTEHSEYGPEYVDNADIYVTVLNPRRCGRGHRQLAYSTYIGGTGRDAAEDLAVRGVGQLVLAGLSRSLDFPVTAHACQDVLLGMQDAVVVELRPWRFLPPTAQLRYSTYFGGTGRDAGNGLYLLRSGEVVISGVAGSDDFPTTDGTVLQGDHDIFITRLATWRRPGKQLVASTLFGGSGSELLCVGPVDDGSTTVYIAGDTGSPDLPGVEGSYDEELTPGAYLDAFVARYNLGSMGRICPSKSRPVYRWPWLFCAPADFCGIR